MGIREDLFDRAADLSWLILAFYVPALWVSVALVAWRLWTREEAGGLAVRWGLERCHRGEHHPSAIEDLAVDGAVDDLACRPVGGSPRVGPDHKGPPAAAPARSRRVPRAARLHLDAVSCDRPPDHEGRVGSGTAIHRMLMADSLAA
jgi:hypothetical protein